MREDEYEVSTSGAVTEEFQQLVAAARARGILRTFLRAARWIMEELARTPSAFGESRDFLPDAQLHLRIGFAGPLCVQFAIHEESRSVFVRRFRLSV